jgi:uncharacterized protein (DUF58 family)
MRRSPKLVVYAFLAAVFFLLALVLGRPELAALGAPFVLVLVVGLSLPRPGDVTVSVELERELAFEGDEVEATVSLEPSDGRAGAREVQLALSLPDGVRPAEEGISLVLALDSKGERSVPLRLIAGHWGGYRLGDVVWRTSDSAGLVFRDRSARGRCPLEIYPRAERLRSLIAPFETQPFTGNRVARTRGEGIEFAEVRPYAPGDRPRRVNWRATSVRQTLYVNEQHPERNSDVVIFLDSYAEARTPEGSTLDLSVRAAASLVRHYLATRDRVGFVSFGAVVRWLTPGSGEHQWYRVIEALLQTEVAFSFAWRDIDTLPFRSLPPQALVIAITPLLDERGSRALFDLRRRGFDLVVVEIQPFAFLPRTGEPLDALATRLWRLSRDALHFRFEELGVAVVQWDGVASLAAAVEEVRAFRRFARITSG